MQKGTNVLENTKKRFLSEAFFLCLFNKPLTAFRTGYLNFSLTLGNAKGVLAGGAAEKLIVFSILKLGAVFLTLILKGTPEAEKAVVFGSSFRDVS